MKARCPIVISPHPSAVRCITRTAELMDDGGAEGRSAGGCDQLDDAGDARRHPGTDEGSRDGRHSRDRRHGPGASRLQCRASRHTALGPATPRPIIERTADVTKAVRDIVTGKTFDNGLLCSSENSVVVDAPLVDEVKRQFVANGAHFLSASEIDMLGKALVTPQRLPNPAFVGKPATYIAQQVGITVAPGTRVLIAELAGVGRDYPLSIEKLCPVLSFYVVQDWKEGCERCKQILRYGGMGHTMSIHSRNEDVILQFGLKKPAFRIVVNTPTTLGSIGFTTSLDPSMTLGCGGLGREHHVRQHFAAAPPEHQAAGVRDVTGACRPERLPRVRAPLLGSARTDGPRCRRHRSRRRKSGSRPSRWRGGSTSS